MKYQIAQKLLQTDWYIVEADSPKEALKVYEETKGNLQSNGSTSGWTYGEEEIVVLESHTDKKIK